MNRKINFEKLDELINKFSSKKKFSTIRDPNLRSPIIICEKGLYNNNYISRININSYSDNSNLIKNFNNNQNFDQNYNKNSSHSMPANFNGIAGVSSIVTSGHS